MNIKLIEKKFLYSIFLLSILIILLFKLNIFPSLNIYFFIDVLFPIIFALFSIFIFETDCISNINDLILIYNKKKYNKILLKKMASYIIFCLSIIISMLLFIYDGNINKSFILFIKTIPNIIFLTIFIIFILKISKSSIASYIVFLTYTFHELMGKGLYTYPLNLFVNYIKDYQYSKLLFIINRSFFIIISITLVIYIIKKFNE